MVQKQVQLNRTLGPSKLCPIENRKRQIDGAGVQAHEFILEPELLATASSGHRNLAFGQELLEYGLIKRPRSMRIGVGESGTLRGISNAQVLKLSFATGQSTADLAETVGTAKLTEEHRNELSPAAEPLGGVVGAVLLDGLFKLQTREQLK